ncbi:MAG: dephospho-CoA kinase [Anaerolineae bacterium]|nr:dephospho-CoA kinase [Phycisphaerae bacterium]
MYAGKPIIGLTGGIGAGKTFIAQMFADAGCMVISSDEIIRQAYKDSIIKQTLKKWWGAMVFSPDGEIDRSAVARKVFSRPEDRKKLEQLLHPYANTVRERMMQQAGEDAKIKAFVWDTPLLMETGLNRLCDKVVFVDAPIEDRLARVKEGRNWSEAELAERENLQLPLDKKKEISDYCISNTANADYARGQVRDTLTRILAETQHQPAPH